MNHEVLSVEKLGNLFKAIGAYFCCLGCDNWTDKHFFFVKSNLYLGTRCLHYSAKMACGQRQWDIYLEHWEQGDGSAGVLSRVAERVTENASHKGNKSPQNSECHSNPRDLLFQKTGIWKEESRWLADYSQDRVAEKHGFWLPASSHKCCPLDRRSRLVFSSLSLEKQQLYLTNGGCSWTV